MDRRYADQPVKPRGAVRSARRAPATQGNGKIRRWLGRLCGAFVVAVVGFAAVQLGMSWSAQPVEAVAIEGEFRFIDKEAVAAKIYQSIDSGFLHLDLRAMQAQLESESWVDKALVSRQWPDALVVKIIEHQPIARWGETDVLNQRGEIIRLTDNTEFSGLPLLTGPDSTALQVMEQYQALARLLRSYKLMISGLQVNEMMSWTLVLKGDLPIVIGKDQIMDKVSRFLLVYQQELDQQLAKVKRIDVRYSNGIAVSWKKQDEDAASIIIEKQHRV